MQTADRIHIPSYSRRLWIYLGGILVLPLLLSPFVAIDPFLEKGGSEEPTLVFAIGSAAIGLSLLVWQCWFGIFSIECGNSLVVHYFFRSRKINWADVESFSVKRRAENLDHIPVVVHQLRIEFQGSQAVVLDLSPELVDAVSAVAQRYTTDGFPTTQPASEQSSTECLHREETPLPTIRSSSRLEQVLPVSHAEGLINAFLGLMVFLLLQGMLALAISYFAGELTSVESKSQSLAIDPVSIAMGQAAMTLNTVDPVKLLEYLVEKSPDNREYQFQLALQYLKAMEGTISYEKGRIMFERKVNPQSRDEFRRKAKLALEVLLADEPENPKYLDVYSKVCDGQENLLDE